MKLLFMLLTTSLLCLSCNKETTTTVEGKVLEFYSGNPTKNVTVILFKRIGNMMGPNGREIIKRVQSNAFGEFAFSFDASSSGNYFVTTEVDEQLYNTDSPADQPVEVGKKNTTNLLTFPNAFLSIHVKNINPVNEADAIRIRANPLHTTQHFQGTSVNEYVENFKGDTTYSTLAHFNCYIDWEVTKGGTKTQHRDTLFLNAFEHFTYYITY